MKPATKITISAVVIVAFLGYAIEQYATKNNTVATTDTNGSNTLPSIPSDTTSSSTDTTGGGATGQYKDGSYTGKVADAFYGPLQAQVTISGGKITNVTYLQQPNDRRETIEIAASSLPKLKAEAIAAQSAKVDVVSGATQNSEAFVQTVQDALNQAKA